MTGPRDCSSPPVAEQQRARALPQHVNVEVSEVNRLGNQSLHRLKEVSIMSSAGEAEAGNAGERPKELCEFHRISRSGDGSPSPRGVNPVGSPTYTLAPNTHFHHPRCLRKRKRYPNALYPPNARNGSVQLCARQHTADPISPTTLTVDSISPSSGEKHPTGGTYVKILWASPHAKPAPAGDAHKGPCHGRA